MPGFITNRGKKLLLQYALQNASPPATFFLALATATTVPTVDTDTMLQISEIAVGNGYASGGIAVARNATDWNTLIEDDTADAATVKIIDRTWTAVGGTLPISGLGARWAFLTTDEATVTSRQILMAFDLVSANQVSAGQPLTIQNAIAKLAEV